MCHPDGLHVCVVPQRHTVVTPTSYPNNLTSS